jgi:putative membrane protein
VIVRPRPSLLKLFFVMHGSIVPRIAPHILGFTLYAIAVVAVTKALKLDLSGYGLAPFALLGVTLSIYLGFRNNAAYDRWWEARKLWGQLIYEVRNLARETSALLPQESGQRRPMLMESLAFCHFLRGQLRTLDPSEVVKHFIGEDLQLVRDSANRADAVLRRMGDRLATLKAAHQIDSMDFRILNERLSSLAAVQAGCERIGGTPLPFAYTLLLHRSAYVFCLLLPLGLAGLAGWGAPLFTALMTYSFFGLDALSEELEDPFGMEANDLALDSLCRICEISVFEALGEAPPPLLEPVRSYYS